MGFLAPAVTPPHFPVIDPRKRSQTSTIVCYLSPIPVGDPEGYHDQ